MGIDNWQLFLDRWSGQWVAAQAALDPEEVDEEALAAGGLGFPPADDQGIAVLEERLGTVLPPSYRAFLRASNGWRHAGMMVYLLGVAEDIHWHGDPLGLTPLYEENLDENADPAEIRRAAMWKRSLQLSLDSDMTDVLLDPGDVGEDGEWPVYVYKGWSGEFPDRYESFADYMQSMYREFHREYSDNADFENEETRELDASVERARLACLAGGDVDELLAVLARADSFGRARARRLRDQITAMTGPPGYLAATVDLDDPLYVREILPVVAAGEIRGGRHRDDEWFLRRYEEEDRPRVGAVLREVSERTFRYEAPGAFGRAVVEAREQARWGDTEAAWRTIADAVAQWEPYSSEQIAPVGLMADPILAPVITPERGRRILNTARGGAPGAGRAAASGSGSGVAPVRDSGPVPVEEPAAGLGWLAGGERGEHSYRLVLVQGVTPEVLAERLGGSGPLLAPCGEQDLWGLAHGLPGQQGAWGPLFRVGSCGRGAGSGADGGSGGDGGGGDGGSGRGGWSFAFELRPETFQPNRLNGLDAEVSRGTRAISLWSERRHAPGEAFQDAFRFSYAEDGRRRFGSTARGGGAESTGTPPEGLDPALFGTALFGSGPHGLADGAGAHLDQEAEIRALDAIAEAFGVTLPRFALRHGRLHAVRGASWTRRPGPGESHVSVSVVPARGTL
ncbi:MULTISPECIES: SMI1/KNR4 family protein [unclassified Streptomyces]|uniref:SMI1/KNR4 family protein n=1 Tax=unclassified Streptomyces TaxID=2593676 RepID=UPI00093D5D5E|nr:SMI1/KNR4 family protein [Streptomyces sp. TSRI0281]OKI32689.1 cell wall assembly protein [Streptomyces sp. TSRI0281]